MEKSEPPGHLDLLAHAAIGAAIEVHRELGPGYLEAVYEAAFALELRRRGIAHRTQVVIPIEYKGARIAEHRIDLLVDDELVVELKAVSALSDVHVAQVISYLKAGAFQLGLLINFNVPLLRRGIRRIIHSG